MNFSEMPVEIWADLLEEQGEDTTELREWIAGGLKVGENIFYSNEDRGDGYNNGIGSGSGDCYTYGDASSYNYTNSNGDGYGDGYSFGFGIGIYYGAGYGNGYDDSTEDE